MSVVVTTHDRSKMHFYLFLILFVSLVFFAGQSRADEPQKQLVQFTAPPEGFDVGFDSGWWPNNKEKGEIEEEPGGFVLQVRLTADAVYSYGADIQGELIQEGDSLKLGNASGTWQFDFGATLYAAVAVDLTGIGIGDKPYVLENIPYVPNFTIHATDSQSFDSFLLDSTSTLHDEAPQSNLFDVDITDWVLGWLPRWVPTSTVGAGLGVDLSILADGSMTCDSITVSDGNTFTEEGQSVPIVVPEEGYNETASYNENAQLKLTLRFFPTLYVEFLSYRYDLPILKEGLPWDPVDGPIDLPFNTAQLNFTGQVSQDPPTDWFTERFYTQNDLDFNTIVFTPNTSNNQYSACLNEAVAYPTPPEGGTVLALGDDDFAEVLLSEDKVFPLYGETYDRIFIASNGYITFTQGDTSSAQDTETHFSMPRVAGLTKNLVPEDGGEISWKQLSDRIVVTYDEVAQNDWVLDDRVSFQVELFFDGTIAITWLALDAYDGRAGLSMGNGEPENYEESNLSSYAPCLVITEGETEGEGEGTAEGEGEGAVEGEGEGAVEGEGEGAVEGEGEGAVEGEGEGTAEGEGEGAVEGEGEGEGTTEGEGEGAVEGEGEGEIAVSHSGDQDGDNVIGLSELLRVIQFFNSTGFQCQEDTEDGYSPEQGNTNCSPHASDYHPNGPDWQIDLSELLRFIQFFNSGHYHACPEQETEDGYCPNAPEENV